MLAFVPAAEKQDTRPADHRVIDPVAWSSIDPHLEQTLSQRLAVAKVPGWSTYQGKYIFNLAIYGLLY